MMHHCNAAPCPAPQAYSPLCKARKLDHPVVVALSQKLGVAPTQLLIRWMACHARDPALI